MKHERFDRIEAYLRGTLPEAGKRAFEAELLTDATLREEMEIQEKLRLGLRALAIENQLNEARNRTRKPATVPIARKLTGLRAWAIAASILAALGIGWGIWQFNTTADSSRLMALAEVEMVDVRYKSMPFDSLQKLTKTASSPLARDKAEWYIALAYMKKGRKKEARDLLAKIAEKPQHTYHGKAKELLEKGF